MKKSLPRLMGDCHWLASAGDLAGSDFRFWSALGQKMTQGTMATMLPRVRLSSDQLTEGIGMSLRNLLASAVLLCSFAGCTLGQPTPYRAEHDAVWSGYGSKVTDLGNDRYEIYNDASPITPDNVPGEHNLLRAAQLAEEKNFSHFVIESAEEGPELFRVPGYGMHSRPQARHIVKLTNNADDAMEVEAVLLSLGQKYLE
ncbi:MAG: hypothetical protein AAFR94_08355 [Pseudomonadota bacterium]